MTTLSETQTQAPRATHLRAYLAGTGATGSLIAGAVIVFLSLATYVAFNGIPFAGNGGSSGDSYVGIQTGGTPAGAAAALAAAPGAVAAAPVPGAPIGAGGPSATLTAGGGAGGFLTGGGGGSTLPGDGTTPPGSIPPGTDPTDPCDTCTPVPDSDGIVGNTINQIDGVTDQNLSGGPVGNVADTVDDTVTGTVNDVGDKIGQPGLGDKVTGDVNDTVDG